MSFQWPEVVELSAKPERLRSAAARLPEPKGDMVGRKVKVQQLKERLLTLEMDEMDKFRMRRRAKEALPYLASERSNLELVERVNYLAIREVDSMSWMTVARLCVYLFELTPFRRKVHARAKKTAPGADMPPWLHLHWTQALGREDPAGMLARAAVEDQPVVTRLLAHLGLRAGTPLGDAVQLAAIQSGDEAWLGQQPYTESLRFIERSGGDPHVRMVFLRRILDHYAPYIRSAQQLAATEPGGELMMVARRLLRCWPTEQRQRWEGMSEQAILVGTWMGQMERLNQLFSRGQDDPANRGPYWGKWVPVASLIEVDERVGTISITLGDWVFTERFDRPSACRVYRNEVWPTVRRRLALTGPQPQPAALLPHHAGWEEEMDKFVSQRTGHVAQPPTDEV